MAQKLDNLTSRSASGMVWLASQTVFARLVGLISQWILANFLLNKEDFGQIALVYTITTIAGQLVDPGTSTVLLQKQRHLDRWASAAFWMSVAISLVGVILMSLVGYSVVTLAQWRGNTAYGNPNILWMVLILAGGAPLNVLSMLPIVKLQSEMRFARLATINSLELLLQQSLLILFAALGFGAFSFVMPMPIVAAIRALAVWIIAPVPVRTNFGIHRWPALIASTGWVFGQRMLNTATSVGDYMVLGAIFANDVLVGQYYFAFNLSMQVIQVLCNNMSAILMPALTAIHSDVPRMLNATERAGRVLAAMVIPVASLQIILAGPAIRLIYVSKWESSIILVQLLSAGPVLLAAAWPYGSMLAAAGRFRAIFFCWIFNAIAFFALVLPFTRLWSAPGTALAVSLWSWSMGFGFAAAAMRSPRGILQVIKISIGPLLAFAVAAIPTALVVWKMPDSRLMDAATLSIATPLFSAIYLFTLRAIDPGVYNMIMTQAAKMAPVISRVFNR